MKTAFKASFLKAIKKIDSNQLKADIVNAILNVESAKSLNNRRTEDGDRRPETGDRKTETGDRNTETGKRRPENGGRRPETGTRRPETGDRNTENPDSIGGESVASLFLSSRGNRGKTF